MLKRYRELANTSKKLDKKKKSKLYSDKHGGSSEQQEAFLHADTDVKPKRSFWKNLFRKIPKKSEVPEMVTDQKSAMLTSKLNAIFEEPKTPEEKEHVVEEIEDLKKTLKRISQVEAAVVEAAAVPAAVVEAAAVGDEPLLEYLSDVSSTSSGSAAAAVVAGAVPALARDGYSFEYSEASEPSLGDEDGRDNKVLTFDEKVEQKDADSNIVVRELSPGPGLHEMEVGADRQEVMTGSGVILVLPPPAPDDQCQQPFKLLDSKRRYRGPGVQRRVGGAARAAVPAAAAVRRAARRGAHVRAARPHHRRGAGPGQAIPPQQPRPRDRHRCRRSGGIRPVVHRVVHRLVRRPHRVLPGDQLQRVVLFAAARGWPGCGRHAGRVHAAPAAAAPTHHPRHPGHAAPRLPPVRAAQLPGHAGPQRQAHVRRVRGARPCAAPTQAAAPALP